MIKTWEDRYDPDGYVRGAARTKEAAMQSEIDELRAALQERDAEIERLNSGWYDKLLEATLVRDEQRKVLEQALKALQQLFPRKGYEGGVVVWRLGASHAVTEAITAIQEVLA